jgi:hypothetical protein
VKPTAHRVCGGIFRADPGLPPDHNGRLTCCCGLVGEAGDAHHPETAPAGLDVQQLRAGENGDEA